MTVHQLKDGDLEARKSSAFQFLVRVIVDVTWSWNILWSDEAHFYLHRQANTLNCRIWVEENLHAIQKKPCILKKRQYDVVARLPL
ncbi:uncharacterized protein TNCV_2227471 [Trichonephila clavipes]|uniref:Transposase n=1 Tax=Trichonephila clavipes TaxID=2585209 RepID=A0A8X6WEK0_TRICX|nr:uncharacterized protein TNCV_2227471 [Trichonephila clavipes]